MNSAFLLAALILDATFALLPRLGLAWIAALAGLLAIAPLFDAPPARVERERLRPWSVVWGVLACAPVIAALALTWGQEFPLVGDHDFHLAMAGLSFDFWRTRWAPAAVALVALLAFARTRAVRWSAPVLLVALVLAAGRISGDMNFAIRYPGAFHFLLFPISAVSRWVGLANPLDASRLAAALSIPAWLFVLRPAILGLWPSPRVLLFAVLFFFQKEVAYYFASPYLEPWALVLLLLAIEHVLVFGSAHAWRAMLLAGLAAVVKEQAILVLPFLGVAVWDRRKETAFAIAWAAVPFAVYLAIRKHAAVSRGATLAPWADLASRARLSTLAERIWLQFGPFVAVLLVLVAAAALAAARASRGRRVLLALLAAAAFQLVFFYCDRTSVPFTGYGRFQLIAHLLLATTALHPGLRDLFSARLRWGFAASATAAQAVTLVPFLALCSSSDVRRNFIEHTDAPIFLPLRGAVSGAREAPGFEGIRRLKLTSNILSVVPGYSPWAESVAYPDLAARFALDNRLARGDPEDCRCVAPDEASIGLFVYFTGLADRERQPAASGFVEACLGRMREGCASMRLLQEAGQTVAAVGFGPR